MKICILHVIESLGVGGAEVLLKDTIALLPEFKHIVCYLQGPDTLKGSMVQYAEVISLNCGTNMSLIKGVFRLRKIIGKEKPSLIHTHLLKPTWVGRLANLGRIPLFFTIHNPLSKDAFLVNRSSLIVEKLTYRKSQHLISVSKESLEDYDKYVGVKGQANILYNFINNRFFEKKHINKPLVNGTLRMVSIGTLKMQKNHQSLISAMAKLKGQNIILDIYGDGPMYDLLNKQIQDEGINMKVNLKGNINDPLTIMGHYDVYILASIYEGFGIAPIEAMSFGLPLILSDLGVFKEIIGAERALYFNPRDIDDIKDMILYMYNNREKAINMSKDNVEYAYEKFSGKEYKRKLLSIYENGVSK